MPCLLRSRNSAQRLRGTRPFPWVPADRSALFPPGCITRGCPQGSSFAPSLATRSALKTSLLFVSTGLTSYHPGRSKVTCCVADVPWARLPSAPLQKHHKGPFPGLLAGSLRLTPFLPESPLHYSSFFPVSKSLSHPFKKAHTVHPTRANSRV